MVVRSGDGAGVEAAQARGGGKAGRTGLTRRAESGPVHGVPAPLSTPTLEHTHLHAFEVLSHGWRLDYHRDPSPPSSSAVCCAQDDFDRENEGDLILPAEFATKENVAFMIRHTSGVVCVGMTPARCEALALPLMVPENAMTDPLRTAFTVTVDLHPRHGTTTGIAAAERAATIRGLVDPTLVPGDFVRPGHLFPLIAKPGGVLQRGGHTESAVDLAVAAGVRPAGFLSEIANDDGTMARLPECLALAAAHDLPVVSIADLKRFRARREGVARVLARCVIARRPRPHAGRSVVVVEAGVGEVPLGWKSAEGTAGREAEAAAALEASVTAELEDEVKKEAEEDTEVDEEGEGGREEVWVWESAHGEPWVHAMWIGARVRGARGSGSGSGSRSGSEGGGGRGGGGGAGAGGEVALGVGCGGRAGGEEDKEEERGPESGAAAIELVVECARDGDRDDDAAATVPRASVAESVRARVRALQALRRTTRGSGSTTVWLVLGGPAEPEVRVHGGQRHAPPSLYARHLVASAVTLLPSSTEPSSAAVTTSVVESRSLAALSSAIAAQMIRGVLMTRVEAGEEKVDWRAWGRAADGAAGGVPASLAPPSRFLAPPTLAPIQPPADIVGAEEAGVECAPSVSGVRLRSASRDGLVPRVWEYGVPVASLVLT